VDDVTQNGFLAFMIFVVRKLNVFLAERIKVDDKIGAQYRAIIPPQCVLLSADE
jgi:hypothetical protein